ncbi:phytanoyl-CoA dioxygenase family protein [Aestuariivirga sp.]|jgi:ectoine hydroxylase-related dioxygenase (phytanoyl-CoA dioxygenase family)|uniref:phytanoyl-CoA dioxygenase family protein n=1 Tax=Aestuariivirga sp. TaxID=2650926 RepID=UPI00378342FD
MMDRPLPGSPARPPVWLTAADCRIDDFRALVEQVTSPSDCPLAERIERNVPVYDARKVEHAAQSPDESMKFMAEWHRVFLDGPGIVVFRGAIRDRALLDAVSSILRQIIAEERAASGGKGDHFAKAGSNARVWNSHEKLCMRAPELFARYAANDVIDLVSRSWLGPLYQITCQVNLVYPGGRAQVPHRDYHMGFQQEHQLRDYPATVHRLSAALTLQGGISHCDMTVDSGATKFLPYSQAYLPGYFATLLPEFRSYFEDHHVQLPLQAGDALFFNPALFHAAGSNVTADVERLANLMQIGSGYGRSIEIVDRARMTKHLYPTMLAMVKDGRLSKRATETLIAATAEGYPFPCNLDIDSPLSGMAPPSQQDILRQALDQSWDPARLTSAIDAYTTRRTSHLVAGD